MSTSDQAVAASPLSKMQAVGGEMTLVELPRCGKLSLRGEPSDAAFVAACEQVLGVAPQATLAPPQHVDTGTLFWIGPNEWLLHCADELTAQLQQQLQQVAEGAHMAVVDVSDYYVLVRLEGDDARAVLSRGTPLDMHAKAFKVGEAVSTRFAKCSVLIHAQSDNCFDVQVRWSHAEYLWQFIAQAASQYG
ncbi:MAG: sarcosine oxidase subunit gamma [Granulosicoccaceae bacterium]